MLCHKLCLNVADAGCVFDVLVVESTSDSEENNRELSNFTSSVFYFFRTCIVALVIGVVLAVAVMSVAVFVGSLIFAMIYIRGLYNNDVAFSMFAHNVCML